MSVIVNHSSDEKMHGTHTRIVPVFHPLYPSSLPFLTYPPRLPSSHTFIANFLHDSGTGLKFGDLSVNMFSLALDDNDNEIPVPSENASVLELMQYNYQRIKCQYMGKDKKEQAVTGKLCMNIGCFITSAVLINQFGDALLV